VTVTAREVFPKYDGALESKCKNGLAWKCNKQPWRLTPQVNQRWKLMSW